MSIACYLVNRSPASSIDFQIPKEVWPSTLTNYSILKKFVCPTYAHCDDGKLNARARKCIFLGYASGVKGYRLWCTNTKTPRLLIERNVVFHELALLSPKKEFVASIDTGSQESVSKQVELKTEHPQSVVVDVYDGEHEEDEAVEEKSYNIAKVRSRRTVKPNPRYAYSAVTYALSAAEETTDGGELSSYSEAISALFVFLVVCHE